MRRTGNPLGRVCPGTIDPAHEVNPGLDRVRWPHQTLGMDVEEMEPGHVAAVSRAMGPFTVNFLKNLPALPAQPRPSSC
jgi:adenosylhomocysteine nucleosidase